MRTAALSADRIPTFSVAELNSAIGNLLERGFAPRFLVEATVSRPQLKKGHLWMSLGDGDASISAVVWASQLRQIRYRPDDGDGVTVVGKLNFWAARANLTVQVLDIRPSLTTVMREFERVRRLLEGEQVIHPSHTRPLPQRPRTVAVLTSVPSSALADMLRTARERWPLTRLLVVPIPVQGAVNERIGTVLNHLADRADTLALDALVLARGGGSREDLAVFDSENLCRNLARFPVPVVTGIGHEDDLTVADLVADHRAATPTAAIVALLPDRQTELQCIKQRQKQLQNWVQSRLIRERQALIERRAAFGQQSPLLRLERLRQNLNQRRTLLSALSPDRWLQRGLAFVRHQATGEAIISSHQAKSGDRLDVQLKDGVLQTRVDRVEPEPPSPKP